MSNIICPSCKTPAPPGAIFCDNCGYDLRTVTEITVVDEPPVQPTYMVPGAGSAGITCPSCGHANIAGSAFCENCGTQLGQRPTPKQPAQPADAPAAQTNGSPLAETVIGGASPEQSGTSKNDSISGRLVIKENNISLPIPSGSQSIVIGREDPVSGVFPDLDLDPHGGHEAGVGRRHAQLILQNGQICIEDLESVNGTAVNKQRIEAHKPHPIQDGDEIRLGKMVLTYMSK